MSRMQRARVLQANNACWCGSGTKFKRCHGDRRALARPPVELGTVGPMRPVPSDIERPPYIANGGHPHPAGRQMQTPESIERMRHAGRVAAEVLIETGAAVQAGITTDELDAIAHDAYIRRGAYPSTLGYRGYPKSICTSVNGVICHGIPDDRPLSDGDIVNIDITAYVGGVHGDTSATFAVGDVGAPLAGLIETTRIALLAGIDAARPGAPLSDIGAAIEPFARTRGYGVIAEYGGHGIGTAFHGEHISHVARGPHVSRGRFEAGMTITVEPMLTTGNPSFATAEDGWTEHTLDAMPSAQFEHTILIAESGPEILTVDADGASVPGSPLAAAAETAVARARSTR